MLLLLLAAAPVWATQQLMEEQLPLHVPFGCINCHNEGAAPSAGDPALNVFGLDFAENDNIWDNYLARLDSDGDGCTNGAEVGDVDGNGERDNGVEEESSNPGLDGDCSSASVMDQATWGELKAMFNVR